MSNQKFYTFFDSFLVFLFIILIRNMMLYVVRMGSVAMKSPPVLLELEYVENMDFLENL